MHLGLNWEELFRRTWQRIRKHRVLDESAMLSFYFLFSIFPLLLFLMTLLGLFLQSEHAFGGVPSTASPVTDPDPDPLPARRSAGESLRSRRSVSGA